MSYFSFFHHILWPFVILLTPYSCICLKQFFCDIKIKKTLVFSKSTPVLDVLHVMFFRENFFFVFNLILDKLFISIQSQEIKLESIQQKNHSTNDKNATINKEWGYTIKSQHATLCSLSVSKTLHVKRSRLVSIGKIPMFLIFTSQKNYCEHMYEQGVKKFTKGCRKC